MILPEKNTIGIYKITSPSGRIYIGQSRDIRDRWGKYISKNNLEYQPKLCNSINKYGVENHVFEIIEECEFEELNIRERYWQDYYEVIGEKGLNCILQETDGMPRVMSDETKMKLSKANKGKTRSEEQKRKQSERMKGEFNQWYGKNFSKSHREKLSKSIKESLKCPVIRKKISESSKGRRHTEEAKLKISLANSGLKNTNSKICKSYNTETNECLFMGVGETARYFNKTKTFIIKRLKKRYKYKIILKEWEFEYVEKERN